MSSCRAREVKVSGKVNIEAKLASFDRYLERFPEGHYKDKAMAGREKFLFEWAKAENTTAGWKRFLAEYPKAKDKKRRKHAKRMVKVTEYTPHVGLSPARIERVNLAEDPEGPLNGYGFEVDVTTSTPTR